MFEIVTKWGALKFASYEDATAAQICLKAHFAEIREKQRWEDMTAGGFVAVADSVSMAAAENNPTVYVEAELVFWADLDLRERENEWELREFCYYKVKGEKFRAHPDDFKYGFDMKEVDWSGDEEERGGDFKEVKAIVAAYIICTTADLVARKI